MESPRLYATFLLWLIAELFEQLPEVGDLPKPKLVFFFDEAHLLFNEAPKALLDKIEQVVRLIRSKGVGVYFVTQNPLDVPDKVLAQLGNRVQHALRAFTPRDQKAVKAAAETFRPNPELDTAQVITELGKGEALVSFLEGNGTPSMVERTLICPPSARVGPLSTEERKAIIAGSPVRGSYDSTVAHVPLTPALEARGDGTGEDDDDRPSGGAVEQPQVGSVWGRVGAVLGHPAVRQFARSVAAVVARRMTEAAMRSLGISGRRRSSRRRDYGIASLGIADIPPQPTEAGGALGLVGDAASDASAGQRGLFGTAHRTSDTAARRTARASASGRQSSTILADDERASPAMDDPPSVGFSDAATKQTGPARKTRRPRSGKAQ